MILCSSSPRVPAASADAVGAGAKRFRRALVSFVNAPATRLHKLLRPGFRHCFALIDDGAGWILIDPLKDRIEIRRIDAPPEFDLAAFYVRRGHRVLVGRVPSHQRGGAIVLDIASCVAVVKRALGIVSVQVQTPHQLYRHLTVRQEPPFRPAGPASKTVDTTGEIGI